MAASATSGRSKDGVTVPIPKTMVEALDFEDPSEALIALSRNSQKTVQELSEKLMNEMSGETTGSIHVDVLPDLLKRMPNTLDADSHPVATAIACSNSILQSLTKIASGGSQASQEIIQLEESKRELEQDAMDVETALILRKASDVASRSLSAQKLEPASAAIQQYARLQQKHRLTKRSKAYAGDYTVTQLESTQEALRKTLLQQYQQAVQASDLQALGKLTPMLQMVQYEKEAVTLYLRFLKGILQQELQKAATSSNQQPQQRKGPPPPYIPMGRVYNAAVTILRHHLPMVSHCLHRADGDAAVIQLINVQMEEAVLPLFENYTSSRQLGKTAKKAQRIYGALESKLSSESVDHGSSTSDGTLQDHLDDAGFSTQIGSLADVDASMEEAVLCLQHAETYTRFIQHTVQEVNKARELRHKNEQEELRMERERKEWSTGMKGTNDSGETKDDEEKTSTEPKEYVPIEILPPHTRLQEKVAEVGGNYAAIEHCLLLASMQRAFAISVEDPRHYSALGIGSNTTSVVGLKNRGSSGPLKTSIVESCLYAARRGSQRAFATGHTGTASAVTNYFVDCLREVLVQYLLRRAEDLGVTPLKPGEGLLEGSAGIFGGTATSLGNALSSTRPAGLGNAQEERERQYRLREGISRSCAALNDLELASHHTHELQKVLSKSVDQGFPPKTTETEQLRMCVKSLGPVEELFKSGADQAVESLLSVLKPRIRTIVTEALGSDNNQSAVAASGFSSAMMMGGTKPMMERHSNSRMNYNLDEDAYQLLEVSESYISRLCGLLDEILIPLCAHLAPRLADLVVLGVLGTVSKRLEVSLKKCRFTALGALSLDSDMRDLIHYAKDRLISAEFNASNVALCNACTPLSRLLQIARLMNLDDLEDVLDLIASSKRKGNWDLKLEEAKAYLLLRVEFDADLVGQLLQAVDEE